MRSDKHYSLLKAITNSYVVYIQAKQTSPDEDYSDNSRDCEVQDVKLKSSQELKGPRNRLF